MQLHTVLRFLILGEILFGITAIALDLFLQSTLPDEVRAYFDNAPSLFDAHFWLATSFTLIELTAVIVAWVGLWHLWNPARLIYLLGLITSYLASPLLGPSVWVPVAGLFYDFSSLCIGGILVLIFFTDLRNSFRRQRNERGTTA